MKLTVLGCWAPYPRAGGACSGYLVQTGGKNILLECGNGVMSNLLKHIDFQLLDGVIISHFHPDHYLDLFCLRHAVQRARRTQPGFKPIPLFVSEQPREPFQMLSGYTEAFVVNPIEKLTETMKSGVAGYEGSLGQLKVSFVKTDHPLPTYAVTVEGEWKLFYSADTKWCGYLPEFAAGADLALCEASVIERDSDYTAVGHLTARQAGELARAAGAGQLIATHFWPEYDLDTIKAEAETGFTRPVVMAAEGLQISGHWPLGMGFL